MAIYDYTNPAIAPEAFSVIASVIGGAILVVSGALFIALLISGHRAVHVSPQEYRFSVAVHPPERVPAALNGFGLWVGLMLFLTLVNYGFPIAHLMGLHDTSVPAIRMDSGR